MTIHTRKTGVCLGILLLVLVLAIPIESIQASSLLAGTNTVTPTATKTTTTTVTTTVTTTSTAKAGTIPTSTATLIIKITINRTLAEFTQTEQNKFITDLATALDIPPDSINVIKVESGSVVMTVEIPTVAAQQLALLISNNDSSITALKITKVDLLGTPTPPVSRTIVSQKTATSAQVKKTSTTIKNSPTTVAGTPGASLLASSGNVLTTFLLIAGGIFIVALLGVGGFLLLRPGNK